MLDKNKSTEDNVQKITYANGDYYEGIIKDGKKNGFGVLIFNYGDRYEGEFLNDNYDGYGVLYFLTKGKYIGEFKNGKKNGKGKIFFDNYLFYEGEFKNGEKDGEGKRYYFEIGEYIGQFKNGREEGFGVQKIKNITYEGEFINGLKNGLIKSTQKTRFGDITFEGTYKNGFKHGYGKEKNYDGSLYIGDYKDDNRNGEGTLYKKNGRILYEGGFKDGYYFGKGKLYDSDNKYETAIFNYNKIILEKNKTENNFNIHYLFLDVETNGLPKNYKDSIYNSKNWPQLLQIEYIAYDKLGNRLLDSKLIVKPIGFTISDESTIIHKITQEKANNEGIEIVDLLNKFSSILLMSKHIVGHNIEFIVNIIASEFYRNNFNYSIITEKDTICTMKESVDYCKIKSSNGYKWPKLEELYISLFNENYRDSYSAINATARSFWELKNSKMHKFNEKYNSEDLINWWNIVKERPNKYTFHESIDKKYLPQNNYTTEDILSSNNILPINYSNNIELIKKINTVYITNWDVEIELNYGITEPVFEGIDFDIASDLTYLCELEYLTHIRYEYIELKNFETILNIKNLNNIYFDTCKNVDLDYISKLHNIKSITLIHNTYKISDIHNLTSYFCKLKSLEYLKITGLMDLVDFSPLYNCENIKKLILN